MYRRLSILSGIAILAVILNHAGGWGLTAMFWWAHRFRDVQVPNYDWIGTFSYYFFDVIHVATVFAVPAFLFISGFFIAYAARGSKEGLSWKTVRARIMTLLIPYLIWSVYVLAEDFALGDSHTMSDMVLRVLLLGANGGFFFIPVLIIFYLLSPWMVKVARTHPRALLIGALVVQLIPILFRYVRLLTGLTPLIKVLLDWTPDQLIIRWAIYFPLGVVAGLNVEAFKNWITRHRKLLLGVLIVSYILMFVEMQLLFQGPERWRPGTSSIFFGIFGVAVILAFLAYEEVKIPAAKWLTQIGGKSYGIYLTHFIFMTLAAKLIYHFWPWLLSQQFLFQPLMFALGLVAPLILMAFVVRTPLRKAYSYLFG